MAKGFNQVTLMGNLTKDPELKQSRLVSLFIISALLSTEPGHLKMANNKMQLIILTVSPGQKVARLSPNTPKKAARF